MLPSEVEGGGGGGDRVGVGGGAELAGNNG